MNWFSKHPVLTILFIYFFIGCFIATLTSAESNGSSSNRYLVDIMLDALMWVICCVCWPIVLIVLIAGAIQSRKDNR